MAIWQKAASSLSSYSKEEGVVRDKLLRKCKIIFSKLKDTIKYFKVDELPAERYTITNFKYYLPNECVLGQTHYINTYIIVLVISNY